MFIREFDLAMETENAQIIGENNAMNINKNREIYDGLRKYLTKLSSVGKYYHDKIYNFIR